VGELNPKNIYEILYFLIIYPRPLITALPILFMYFIPNFHPRQRDNSELIKKYSEMLKKEENEIK
jgi:predicted metal-dependent hydrolase